MRIAITGSSGVIGQSMCKYLSEVMNYDVVGIDIDGEPNVLCDVTNRDLTVKVLKKINPDVIVHLAAKTNPAESFRFMYEDMETNIFGTRNVLEYLANEAKAGREKMIVFTSSCAVYGDAFIRLNRPISELDVRDVGAVPTSPYGVNKLAAEEYIRLYSGFGIDYLIMRLGNIYSEYDNKYLLWTLYKSKDRPFKLYGNGDMYRDMCYVGDMNRFVAKILQQRESGKRFREVANIGHEKLRIGDIVDEFVRLYSYPTVIEPMPIREGEFRSMLLSTSIAKSLGFEPKVKLISGDGLERCVNFFKEREKLV